MGILCVINGLLFIAGIVVSIIGLYMVTIVGNHRGEILTNLIEKGNDETECQCGIINLETKMSAMRWWGMAISAVCGINFTITLLFWLNILSI